MRRLFRNKLFIGAVCLLLAGILVFGLLPRLYNAQSSIAEIVRLKETVVSGIVITADMLTVTEVGSYGLPDGIVKDKSEIVGLVANETVYAGEYLWRNRFVSEDDYESGTGQTRYGLSEGTYLMTMSLPTASSGIAGVLRSGDIVDVYGYAISDGVAAVTGELTAVTVYRVLNSKLMPLDDLDAMLTADPSTTISDYDFKPAYVIFAVNEQQAKVLIGLEKEESLHLVLRETGAQP